MDSVAKDASGTQIRSVSSTSSVGAAAFVPAHGTFPPAAAGARWSPWS